jgi:Flp pilus assembly protein TadB
MVLAALLIAGARLLWPARPASSPGPVSGGHPCEASGAPSVLTGRDGAERLATATVDDVADALVLLSLALRGGRSPLHALDDVAGRVGGDVGGDLATVAAFHRWGVDGLEAWSAAPAIWEPAAAAWVAAEQAGVSPGPLLDRAALSVRARGAAVRETALQRAAVLLVLPLGVAFLPGFVLTTVAPTVWRLLPALLGG